MENFARTIGIPVLSIFKQVMTLLDFEGSVIIFTGLLSVAFLDRILKPTQWIGITFILAGLSVVGCSDFLVKDGSEVGIGVNKIITGK